MLQMLSYDAKLKCNFGPQLEGEAAPTKSEAPTTISRRHEIRYSVCCGWIGGRYTMIVVPWCCLCFRVDFHFLMNSMLSRLMGDLDQRCNFLGWFRLVRVPTSFVESMVLHTEKGPTNNIGFDLSLFPHLFPIRCR